MTELISLQNAKVKRLVKLRCDPAYRQQEQAVVIVGTTLCIELTADAPATTLFVRSGYKMPATIQAHAVTPVSEAVFVKIAGIPTTEPVIAELSLPPQRSLAGATRILALDGISDPGNLGTLLRTALGLGWDGAVFLEGCADPFNEKAIRASRGALFFLPHQRLKYDQLPPLIKRNGLASYVGHIQGTPLHPELTNERMLLVMANEARGPSTEVLSLCKPITIPMLPQMQSLNVAAAGAIFLHAFQKRV